MLNKNEASDHQIPSSVCSYADADFKESWSMCETRPSVSGACAPVTYLTSKLCPTPPHQHHDDQPELKLCDVFFWLSGSVCAVARSDEVCFFLCVSQSWRCLQESDAVKLYRFSLKEALEGAASCFWTDLPFFLKSLPVKMRQLVQ